MRPIQSGEVESGIYARSVFPDEREAAVYQAVLGAMFPTRGSRPLLSSFSIPPCPRGRFQCGSTSPLALLLREGSLDSSTVVDYNHKSGELIPFNTSFALGNRLNLLTPEIAGHLIAEDVSARPEENHHFDDASLWHAIRLAYPKAAGVVSFTRPGFDLAGSEALVMMRHQRSPSIDTYQTMLLRFSEGAWRVERTGLERERVSAEVVDGRCLVARREPGDEPNLDLRGTFAFMFVHADGAVERRTLDLSRQSPWRDDPDDWDISVDRILLKIGAGNEREIFGTWMDIGRDVYPIDVRGNRIPEKHGHFCARRIEAGDRVTSDTSPSNA